MFPLIQRNDKRFLLQSSALSAIRYFHLLQLLHGSDHSHQSRLFRITFRCSSVKLAGILFPLSYTPVNILLFYSLHKYTTGKNSRQVLLYFMRKIIFFLYMVEWADEIFIRPHQTVHEVLSHGFPTFFFLQHYVML